jgi:hypothetical protein
MASAAFAAGSEISMFGDELAGQQPLPAQTRYFDQEEIDRNIAGYGNQSHKTM